ncbi:MAG: plasmid pRiA4b ORF-3 family protein [Bacteroidota bacterium]
MKATYQIQISLQSSKPKIWRRILIPSDMKLSDFHKVIQTSMGWTNSHLHQFIKDGNYYLLKMKDDIFWDDMDNVDYKKMKVSDLLTFEKEKMVYEYDFGDSWYHDIVLEKIHPFQKDQILPVCIKGKMNCPPEDCGGVWGYLQMLEILSQPGHEEYNSYLEWLGEEFDPEHYNQEEINAMLREKNFGAF